MNRFPKIPTYSVETSKVIELLNTATNGVVEYQQIEQAIRFDRKHPKFAAAVQSACRYMLRTPGINQTWKRVYGGQAVKRLDGPETVGLVESEADSMRRKAKRSIIKLATVNDTELDNGTLVKANVLRAQLGTLSMVFDSRSAKRIESMPTMTPKEAIKALAETD